MVCYGPYASMNEDYLRSLGAQTVLGGEFEQGLADLARRLPASSDAGDGTAGADAGSNRRDVRSSTVSLQIEPVVSLARQRFITPDRRDLPELDRYAHFIDAAGQSRRVGYTEATRGCKHTCRHCPIVTVYGGHFRVVAPGGAGDPGSARRVRQAGVVLLVDASGRADGPIAGRRVRLCGSRAVRIRVEGRDLRAGADPWPAGPPGGPTRPGTNCPVANWLPARTWTSLGTAARSPPTIR
jgi:hypothetical protein